MTRLPGRTLAWYATLAGAALVLSIVFSRALEAGDPVYDPAPIRHASAPLDEVEALLLGNSQFRGVRPESMPIPFANYALPGSDYVIQLAIFEELLPHMSQLQTLLLGFDNVPLHTQGIQRRDGDYRDIVAMGVPWWKIPEVSAYDRAYFALTRQTFLRPYFTGDNLTFERFHDWLLPAAVAATCESDLDPGVVRTGFTVAPANGANKMVHYQRSLARDSHLNANQRAFERIFDHCRERGIQVVLLRSPTVETFWKARSDEWDEELNRIHVAAKSILGESGVSYWDDETTGVFSISCFADPNHLSSEGFQIYSEMLAAQLERIR